MKKLIYPVVIVLLTPLFPGLPGHVHADSYFLEAARTHAVPVELLLAVAREESGMRPWALNIAGQPHFPTDKTQALELIRVARAQGKSFDQGLMQVNRQWVDRLGLDDRISIEPRLNVHLGAMVMADCLHRYGSTWKALGCYHAGDPDRKPGRSADYAVRVKKRLQAVLVGQGQHHSGRVQADKRGMP